MLDEEKRRPVVRARTRSTLSETGAAGGPAFSDRCLHFSLFEELLHLLIHREEKNKWQTCN